MRRLLVPLACAALLAGCGNERQEAPSLADVVPPQGEQPANFPRAGVTFTAPANWLLRERPASGVFSIQSGAAFVTGFAYPREEDLPETPAELTDAEDRLIGEVEERDPQFELISSRILEVDGAPAIEVRGVQTLDRRPLQTRSVHVYKGEVEYVFEAIAPAGSFELASGRVLRTLLATVELSGRVRED